MHRYWPHVKVALSPSWEVSLYSWLGIFMLWHHWSPIKLKTIQHGCVYKQKELFEAKLHHSVDSYVPLSLQNKPCGNITMSLDKFWSSLKLINKYNNRGLCGDQLTVVSIIQSGRGSGDQSYIIHQPYIIHQSCIIHQTSQVPHMIWGTNHYLLGV